MKNLDLIREQREKILQSLSVALVANDETGAQQALEDLSAMYSEMVTDQINGVMQDVDRTILAGRGVRQLTSAETKFYQAVIDASKSASPKQAIANIDVAFPETIIDAVLEDIAEEHPLLGAIDFVNTTLLTRWIRNAQGRQQAVWGQINAQITEELEGEIESIPMDLLKLTAFMFVTQDMLTAGPAWVDRYARAILVDALSAGQEDGVINGNGKDQPIGMTKKDEVDSSSKEYKDQTAVELKEITPQSIGAIVGSLAKTPTGRSRKVNGLILVVNPTDYYTKVMPATTVQNVDGTYRNDIFPVPCQVIQSEYMVKGKAVIGIGKNYFLGMGLPEGGKLEYSDEFKFLEDLRTYKIKFIGNGMPKDFNSFKLLDISKLAPMLWTAATKAKA